MKIVTNSTLSDFDEIFSFYRAATAFQDEQIWQERNADNAMYIHRVALNRTIRGINSIQHIVDWAVNYAKGNMIQYIRLDTLGENKKLINHYINAGFNFLGMFELQNTDQLPGHYQSNEPAALFEISLF